MEPCREGTVQEGVYCDSEQEWQKQEAALWRPAESLAIEDLWKPGPALKELPKFLLKEAAGHRRPVEVQSKFLS